MEGHSSGKNILRQLETKIGLILLLISGIYQALNVGKLRGVRCYLKSIGIGAKTNTYIPQIINAFKFTDSSVSLVFVQS